MEHIKKYLNMSNNKIYYEQVISKLTDEQKNKFESLLIRFEHSGAKDPLSWAISEITEGIPQLGRFLVLKTLFNIGKSVSGNINLACSFDQSFDEKYNEIKNTIGEERLSVFLELYSNSIIYSVIEFLDEGNEKINQDKISWTLVETNEDFESTGRIIQSLHEDFLNFNNKIT